MYADQALVSLPGHDHIIPLYDIFLPQATKELHIVFECMEGNLYQLIQSRRGCPLANGLLCSIVHQTLLGLDHIHSHGYFHRDMKPENLLITTTGLSEYPRFYGPLHVPIQQDVLVLVKIADFGLARETSSTAPYSEYVSTRWYRAPEVLLRAPMYGPPMDIWALGTIIAELVNMNSLFPGANEPDQLMRIIYVLGSPRPFDYSTGVAIGGGPWLEGYELARRRGFVFPNVVPTPLANYFPQHTMPRMVDIMQLMLLYDPSARITTREALQHPFVTTDAKICQPIRKIITPRIQVPESSRPHTPVAPEAMAVPDVRAKSQFPSHSPQMYSPEPSPASQSPAHSPRVHNSAAQDRARNSPQRDSEHATERLSRLFERTKLHGKGISFMQKRRNNHSRSASDAPMVGGKDNGLHARTNSGSHTSTYNSASLVPAPGDTVISQRSAPDTPTQRSDSRRSRKEAQRIAKEQELAHREAEYLAMRERSRAVLQKRKQLSHEILNVPVPWRSTTD